jgi:hypothetical protein
MKADMKMMVAAVLLINAGALIAIAGTNWSLREFTGMSVMAVGCLVWVFDGWVKREKTTVAVTTISLCACLDGVLRAF